MQILRLLRSRFEQALAPVVNDPAPLLEMIRPAQDPRHGDYQANCAMPLGKQWGKQPREVGQQIADALEVEDICLPPQVAGPGFINLTLRDEWLGEQLRLAAVDARLSVASIADPRTYVVDYSSPNVAKPMHVGHIRSTVIGAALDRLLRFRGHRVISDNHIGDWGTQFGMIIYGYKHFVDPAAFAESPVAELSRLYRLVNQLIEYHEADDALAARMVLAEQLQAAIAAADAPHSAPRADSGEAKAAAKERARRMRQMDELRAEIEALRRKRQAVEDSPALASLASQHVDIAQRVLDETAKLHAGDAENVALWRRFLPDCRGEMEKMYRRLDISFDHELGESFYHDRLGGVVEDLQRQGLARDSDGAVCVFLEGYDAPMIVRKRDGAFLYATSDLATIEYRVREFNPDEILYVVDHRQGEHFEKLFAAARAWGYTDVVLRHISFGTVLGADGRPYKTRSGSAAGLEALLDEAVVQALEVVSQNDDAKPNGPELDEQQRQAVANAVGHAAVKYADLSHNRTSDYKFDAQQMVQFKGNTAAYLQYSYARIRSIFRQGNVEEASLASDPPPIMFRDPLERALAIDLLRFEEALDDALVDYRPNVMTAYLHQLASSFARFFDGCQVLKAETSALRDSRLLLCMLAGRTLRTGLATLGIQVVEKM